MENLTDNISFESLLFKRMVIPGIVIELLMAFLICIPTGINLNLLTRPVGGPPGIAIQAGMFTCVSLMLPYLMVACIYAAILLYKYYKRSSTFLDSTRRFFTYSILVLLTLDFLIVFGWVEFVRWNYVALLNIPVVASLTSLAFVVTIAFIYWTIRIYKEQQIRFLSWKTAEGFAIFIGAQFITLLSFYVLL